MKKIFVICFIAIVASAIALPFFAHAQSAWTPPNIWPLGYWGNPNTGLLSCNGNYTASTAATTSCRNLCDLIDTFINIVYFGMSIAIFILAPFFIVIGGIMIMVSGAKPEMLSTGKKTLTGTVIGLLIVLCSYLVLSLFISILGLTNWIPGFSGSGSLCSVPTSFAVDHAVNVAFISPLPFA